MLQTGCSSEEICTRKPFQNNVWAMLNLCLTVYNKKGKHDDKLVRIRLNLFKPNRNLRPSQLYQPISALRLVW